MTASRMLTTRVITTPLRQGTYETTYDATIGVANFESDVRSPSSLISPLGSTRTTRTELSRSSTLPGQGQHQQQDTTTSAPLTVSQLFLSSPIDAGGPGNIQHRTVSRHAKNYAPPDEITVLTETRRMSTGEIARTDLFMPNIWPLQSPRTPLKGVGCLRFHAAKALLSVASTAAVSVRDGLLCQFRTIVFLAV